MHRFVLMLNAASNPNNLGWMFRGEYSTLEDAIEQTLPYVRGHMKARIYEIRTTARGLEVSVHSPYESLEWKVECLL